MAEFWENDPVAQPAAAPPTGNFWEADKVAGQPIEPPTPSLGSSRSGIPIAAQMFPHVAEAMKAFGQGFEEGWGPDRLGVDPETAKWLREKEVFGPTGTWSDNPVQATHELLANSILGAGQILFRGASGVFRGGQAAVADIGEQVGQPQLGRDVAAIPEAFFGTPHPMGIPRDTVMLNAQPEFSDWFRGSKAVDDRGQPIPLFHGTSLPAGKEFQKFEPSMRGSATGAPSAREAFFFSEDRDLAASYADSTNVYNEFGPLNFINRATGGLYEHFNETLLKPFGLSGKREGKIVTAHLSAQNPLVLDYEGKEFREESFFDAIQRAKENGHDSVLFKNALDPGFIEDRVTGPSNIWAVFDPDKIRIRSFESGDPNAMRPALAEARELGVIGPPKPDLTNATPAEKAAAEVPPPARAMAAARTGDDVLQGPAPGAPEKAGNIRLDQIGINADAKDVILEAAKNNDDFNQARAGNVPLAQVESLSGASGVPSDVLTGNDGLGRVMHNDAVVRTWLQAFHQATDEIAGQMKTVAATGDEADIAKLREMKLRFQHMQEQVSGLTAEAGRTLRVFRDFYDAKGKAEALGKVLEDNPGNDVNSLKKLADMGKGLDDPAQVAKLLNDARKPTFWDKYLYYWVNALISGPVTHLKYIGANAAFGAYEAGVVTPIAGALGMARRAVTGGTEGVYAGEAAARAYGLLAGTPDALRAAWTAAKNNVMTPFPNEVAGKQVNPLTQTRPSPIGGRLGFAIGIPGRSAAGIHSFFRWLGYRAELEAQAYRGAAKEGLSPTDGDAFWQRYAWHAENPTDKAMDAAIDNGNHLTFISEQGAFGRGLSQFANKRYTLPGGLEWQPVKLILPFTHIPGQILRAGLEQTPAAFLDAKARGDLLGQNGAVAADTARARLVAGGAVSAMVANWAINDTITGYGPTEQSERARWLRSHEPYSVRIGGWWYSYNKFGPIGDLMGLVSNMVDVGPAVKEHEYAQAAGHVVWATSHILQDEVGMQGLVNMIEALDDKEGSKMARFVSSQAASNLPYSSLLRQTASFNDPYMREAKNFIDELRYSTPWSRQDLLPKRDWLGQPVENPGYHDIIRQRAVNTDPIDLEIAQLRGFKPGPPQPRINGVALPPHIYDEYQTTAGGLTRAALERMVTAPGWEDIPPGIREQTIHATVESMRKAAGAMTQVRHPEIIQQGVQDRKDKINGVKPTKLQE